MLKTRRALVAGVVKGGLKNNGIIQDGDAIITCNGRPKVKMPDMPGIVAERFVGMEVNVVVFHKGAEINVKATAEPPGH
jgi:S1-C subfamily serine protease